MKTFKQHLKEASMWDFIYRKNKGIFYRGVGKGGKGTGLGALGKGVYLTWERGMAQAFADRQGAGGEVKEYKLKRSLKIVDVEADKDFADVKAEMGFGVKQFSDDPMFAGMLTMMLKDKGYDGAVSDDVATGICIFDEKNVKEVK
jgi:hypothetical protein